MPIYDLFSKRKAKAENAQATDVYQYTTIPTKLRVQIQQILLDAIGPQYEVDSYGFDNPKHNPEAWDHLHKILCRELGVHSLTKERYSHSIEAVINFLTIANIDGFMDATEIACKIIDKIISGLDKYERAGLGIKQDAAAAIEEINYRFREAGVGYQYQDGQIFRIDSEYMHQEVLKPALSLLKGEYFAGAQDEFLKAHQHYRNGEYEQSIVWAARSFESALKGACAKRKWKYEKGARAVDLLKTVRSNGLWPDYLDGSFDQLLATLASGLPKVRNDAGGHGQGPHPRTVPAFIASYALNLAAAKMILLVEAVG